MNRIFKRKNKQTSGGKFAGVTLPKQIASYLWLYSLTKGVSKSTIIRGQMQQWYSQERKTCDEAALIKPIVDTIQREWEQLRKQYDAPSFDGFKQQVKNELKKTGIDADHIYTILTMLGP